MEYDIEINSVGTKFYYKKGTKTLHREGGPTIIGAKGSLHWIINGIYHKTDGPAKEYFDGYKEWWFDGVRLSPEKEIILNKWWDNKKQ